MLAVRASSKQASSTAIPGVSREGIPFRIWILAGVLALECLAVAQISHPWLSLQQLMAAPIAFGAALLFFGRNRLRSSLFESSPVSARWIALHVFALAAIFTCATLLLKFPRTTPALARALIWGWFGAIALSVISLAVALFSPRSLARLAKDLGAAWGYAFLTALVAMAARVLGRSLWDTPHSPFGHALQQATFYGVRTILSAFYAGVISDPNSALLGTRKFLVQVAGACSGIEGLALMLVLTVGWLIVARRELKLARAVWLIPLSLSAVWLLNLVRITVLIAIGDAGHKDIAINGFHSEAGWILFNAIAIAFLAAAQNISWLRKDAVVPAAASHSRPVGPADRRLAEAFLLPFLAVVAVSFLTRAVSNGFEALYPLRFIVALGILWHFRADYRKLDWRFGWLGPACGVLVFILWIATAHFTLRPAISVPTSNHFAAGLFAMPVWQRTLWLTIRILSAVVTVPIAEELAFRGYLARRILSADVASVPYRQLSTAAVILSAVAFGLLYGRMAVAGILAGILFALIAKARNRLGEAIAAHATANLLLAIWILSRGDYSLW